MSRVLAVLAACLVLCGRTAAADTLDTSTRQLSSEASYKVRLAAALALSKSRDARAVIALADALEHDDEATIRRVAALALGKLVDKRTADDARELAFTALDHAAVGDRDAKVRKTAASTVRALATQRRRRVATASARSTGNKPPVFVNVDSTTDQTKRLPSGGGERVLKIVKASVEKTGYATTWPGGLPTVAELTSSRSRAFIVASTVKKIEISQAGAHTQIACTVAIRIAPWSGKDGGETWEANKAASASGSAKATTGNKDREIQSGVRECIEAVAEDVTDRQVVPFLKRLATTGS